jgi:PAS domain S-box-containing protein
MTTLLAAHIKFTRIFKWITFLPLALTLIPPAGIQAHTEHASPVALTGAERTWLDDNPDKLTLYFNASFPPIEFASDTGAFVGLGADLIALIEQRLSIRFHKLGSDDWNQHLAALESGACAVAPTIVRTTERERFAFFTSPYETVPVVIIGTGALGAEKGLDDLAGRRVAVVAGYATESFLRERAQGRFEIVPMPDVVRALRATSFGQVDAFVENLAVASHYIQQEGIPDLQVVGNTDYRFAFSIGVSRRYPLLYSAVAKALDSVSPAELASIRKRWISLRVDGSLSPETLRWITLIGVFTALLLMGLAAISYILRRRLREKIDHLKHTRQELLDQTELLRLAMEGTQAGIWTYAPATGRNFLSKQWFAMLGYPAQDREVDAAEMRGFIHPEDLPAVLRALKAHLKVGGKVLFEVEMRLRKADGTWCWVLSKGRAVAWDEAGAPARLIGLDFNIQTVKEASLKLAQSQGRLRTVIDTLPDLVWLKDPEGFYLACNKKFERFFGAKESEIIGKSDYDFMDETSANFFREKDRLAIAAGKPCLNEEEVVYRDDGHREALETIKTPMFDDQGKVVGVLGIARDITERKRSETERQKLQDQLLQAQKLEAVGILAGGVAHDFNNMLGAIIGYSELLMDGMVPAEAMRPSLAKILDAARRSSDLTRQLLAFARKQNVAPVVFDLNEAVASLLKMLRRLIGENIDLTWLPRKGHFPVCMDPSHLDQLLTNLCVNARDAIADVGRITIMTDTAAFDQAACEAHADCAPGDYVLLSVSDSGSGMDQETLAHIFEPFFTTKGIGRGTGLGLATVYGVVKQNEGFIRVNSAPGAGTTFNIYLPQNCAVPSAPKPTADIVLPPSRGETILLAEDDPTLLQMGELMLQRLGYGVLCASTPAEAIRLAEAGDIHFDLFITDVVMPEMNGRELADRILALRPTVKHLFMSGYTADVIGHRGVLDEAVNFIQKPFSLHDMAVKIRAVLDKA